MVSINMVRLYLMLGSYIFTTDSRYLLIKVEDDEELLDARSRIAGTFGGYTVLRTMA